MLYFVCRLNVAHSSSSLPIEYKSEMGSKTVMAVLAFCGTVTIAAVVGVIVIVVLGRRVTGVVGPSVNAIVVFVTPVVTPSHDVFVGPSHRVNVTNVVCADEGTSSSTGAALTRIVSSSASRLASLTEEEALMELLYPKYRNM